VEEADAVRLLTAADATAVESGSEDLEYAPIPAAVTAATRTVYDSLLALGKPET
jgi:hypothetical protein